MKINLFTAIALSGFLLAACASQGAPLGDGTAAQAPKGPEPEIAAHEPLEGPPCAPYHIVYDSLTANGLRLAAQGIFQNGDLLHIFVGIDGSWIMVWQFQKESSVLGDDGRKFVLPPGAACRIDQGFGWKALSPDWKTGA